MKRIGHIMQRTDAAPKHWDEKSIFYAFQRAIREEYGAQGIKHLTPDFWKNGIMFVKASSATWGGELQLNERAIVKKVNQELDGQIVRAIKVK